MICQSFPLTPITVAITGPSAGGLGAATAIALASGHPADILLLGRTESKSASVIEKIKSISPETSVKFIPLDLTRYDSIKSAAAKINESVKKIDVLINNAGVMALNDYTVTPEGIEAQFGANHIGHFLLTNLLLPKIETAAPGARIVNLTSNGHQLSDIHYDDYNFANGKTYNKWVAYGQSKTANILFTTSLASKLAAKGILSFSVHPGNIITNLGTHVDPAEWPEVGKLFEARGHTFAIDFKSLEQGPTTTLVAALDPSIASESGGYLDNSVIATAEPYARDPQNAEELWALSEKIVGQKFTL